MRGEVSNLKEEVGRITTSVAATNTRMDKVLETLGKTNENMAKLAGKLGGANYVIPVMTLAIGVLGTLVAVHI